MSCTPCRDDDCNNCASYLGSCICASNNHEGTFLTGVILSKDTKEPKEYEAAQNDAERLEDLLDGNVKDGSIKEVCRLLVISGHIVDKEKMGKKLWGWCEENLAGVPDDDIISGVIDELWGDIILFGMIKNICWNKGVRNEKITLGAKSFIECAEWIKGRYWIKRIQLNGDLLFWNDMYYEVGAESHIRRACRVIIPLCKNKDVIEIVKYIQDTCVIIEWRDIEKSIHLKCVGNGTYDIKQGVFSESWNPAHIILNQVNHDYVNEGDFSAIQEKVKEIIPEDHSRQSFWDFLSTCLHPYTGVDYQFGCVGGTGTGKSQLGVLAEMVLGEDNVGDATIHQIAKDQTTQKNMAFKMLNVDYDMNSESIKQIDVLKKWITQDRFTARGIYEQSTTFRPMSRLMFMANDLYEISNEDDAEAIYDRTYIIRVERKFRHYDMEIKQVMKKVANNDQLNELMSYLLRNSNLIYKSESFHHPISVGEVENIWNTFGNRIKMFIQKWVVKGASERTESSEPYNRWLTHCMTNHFKPKDKKRFTNIFNEVVGNTPSKTRIDNNECYAYSGFRLKNEKEVALDETQVLK